MAENKTKATAADVDAYLARIEPQQRRDDAAVLRELMQRVSGEPAKLWGPSIVGFGSYHYRYASGHEGDAPRIAFSPRKSALVLYLKRCAIDDEPLLARLGKHSLGKGCLYIKRLSDVDMAVLEQLVRLSLAHSDQAHA